MTQYWTRQQAGLVRRYPTLKITPLGQPEGVDIAIVTPVHGRLDVAKLYWAGINRLRQQWTPYTVIPYISGNEPEHREMTLDNGGVWIETPNFVGAKFNAAMLAAHADKARYAMVLGSDDLVTPKLARQYLDGMQDGIPYFGVRRVSVLEPSTLRACSVGNAAMHRRGEIIGAGRVVSGAVINRAEGRFWRDDMMTGNDGKMSAKLSAMQVPAPCCFPGTEDACVIDVKGPKNIWSYNHIATFACSTRPINYNDTVGLLSPEEQALLRDLEIPQETV